MGRSTTHRIMARGTAVEYMVQLGRGLELLGRADKASRKYPWSADALPASTEHLSHRLLLFQSTLIFDDQLRQSLLFDDDNFTNAKRYFWALQSLRIFDDYIDGTLRLLRKARRLFEPADDVEMHIQKFGELKARIERKRQEVESLNNGVSTRRPNMDFEPSPVERDTMLTTWAVPIALLSLFGSRVAFLFGAERQHSPLDPRHNRVPTSVFRGCS